MNYFANSIKKFADLTQVEQVDSSDSSGVFIYPVKPSFMRDKETYQSALDLLIELNKLVDIESNKINKNNYDNKSFH